MSVSSVGNSAFSLPHAGDEAARPLARRVGWSRTSVGFGIFLLVNAVLFLRPMELLPALKDLRLYELLIFATIVCSLPVIFGQFSVRRLAARPITVCVLGILLAVVISHLTHGRMRDAAMSAFDFAKRVAYYLLFVGLVSTRRRLRGMLIWLAACIVVLTALALLQYHHVVDLPALAAYEDHSADQTGNNSSDAGMIERLRSCGIFNDPNDLALILVFGVVVSFFFATERRARLSRAMWFGAVGLFLYAIFLTHSRGGFLALVAAVLCLNLSRYGWRKTIILSTVLMPILFLGFAGRQTHLSTDDTTAQDRIHLWSDGLQLFKASPLFGIGMNRFADEEGLVVHNSFLHSMVELGFFGGTLFLGAFAYSIWALHRLKKVRVVYSHVELRRFRPYLAAIVGAYVVGYLALSRTYVEPTYLVLGLTTVFLRLAPVDSSAVPRLTWKLAGVGALLGCGFIVGAYGFVRVFAQWG